MPAEIEVSCPGCNAIFVVPHELGGEMAECAECNVVFEIPKIEHTSPEKQTDTGVIKGIAASAEFTSTATNTVKLSRSSIGMIPNLKDDFIFGTKSVISPASSASVVSAPAIPAPQPFSAKPPSPTPFQPSPPPFSHPSSASASVASMPTAAPYQPMPPFKQPQQSKPVFAKPPSPAPAAAQPTPASSQTATKTAIADAAPATIPTWTQIRLKADENVYACKEVKENPVLTAALISLPALISSAGVFLVKIKSDMFICALALTVAVWIITFVIAFLFANEKSRRAIILTSHRAICMIGKNRIEVKK